MNNKRTPSEITDEPAHFTEPSQSPLAVFCRDTRGQTFFDFVIGITLFLFIVFFVVFFIPDLLDPFEPNPSASTALSDRGADHLTQNVLHESGEGPYVLNTACTTAFFSGDATDECDVESNDPREIMGLDSNTEYYIAIYDGDEVIEEIGIEKDVDEEVNPPDVVVDEDEWEGEVRGDGESVDDEGTVPDDVLFTGDASNIEDSTIQGDLVVDGDLGEIDDARVEGDVIVAGDIGDIDTDSGIGGGVIAKGDIDEIDDSRVDDTVAAGGDIGDVDSDQGIGEDLIVYGELHNLDSDTHVTGSVIEDPSENPWESFVIEEGESGTVYIGSDGEPSGENVYTSTRLVTIGGEVYEFEYNVW